MIFKTTKLRDAISFALAMGALAGSSAAFAQDATTTEKETTTLDRVEVLGSRIRRVEGESSVPVLSLSRADLEKTGLTQIGDVLKELSVNGPSISLNTNNGNTSGNTGVNLRNCGSNRTLVLVNGRRWVSNNGLGGSVDLSSIPMAAVERVEVLKDGASALYGSDALCGVINIMTRTNFEGAEVHAYMGQYDKGDGTRQAYDVTLGGSGERWSALLNVAYTKQDAVSAGDREISAVPLFGFPANTGFPGRASDTTPYGTYNVGGVIRTLDPSRPGCLPNQVCSTTVATTDFRPYDGTKDAYNFAPDNYLIQPQTQKALFAQGSYDITENLRFRNEVFYTNRRGEAQLAAQPLTSLAISATNIYNPFRTAISGGAIRPINFPRSFGQDQDTWRWGSALEGNFEFADRSFYWDAGYTYAENRQTQLKTGFYFSTRVANALGPSFVDANGVARCGTASAVIADCVPLNVFGGPEGITQQMFNYIAVSPRNLQKSTQESYTANLSGDLFELPGGWLSFAAGYEHRKETGSDNPDPLTSSGLVLGDNPVKPTQGAFDIDEFYGELQIPLLKDVAFAKSLELSVAARYSDYSNFGNTTNPKFSFRWQPFDDLLVRGSWGKGFRAPSISELFSGVGSGRPSAVDPCSNNSSQYLNSAQVRANCAAAGVPTTFRQASAQLRASSGGNPELSPETSTQRTLGFVYSPSFIEGFDFYVDWYNIKIQDSIGSRGIQSIVDDCYVGNIAERCAEITRDFTGSVSGRVGEISDILATVTNFRGGLETEGFDFGGGYKFETSMGRFDIRWDNAYVSYYGDIGQLERGEINSDGEISGGNLTGRLPSGSSAGAVRWRLRSNLATTWSQGPWSATANLEYASKIQATCNNVVNTANALGRPDLLELCSDPNRIIDNYQFAPGTKNVIAVPTRAPVNEMEPVWYLDLQGSYKTPWSGKITLGVRNITDETPPYAPDSFANSFDAQYRIPGRFMYMSYEQKF